MTQPNGETLMAMDSQIITLKQPTRVLAYATHKQEMRSFGMEHNGPILMEMVTAIILLETIQMHSLMNQHNGRMLTMIDLVIIQMVQIRTQLLVIPIMMVFQITLMRFQMKQLSGQILMAMVMAITGVLLLGHHFVLVVFPVCLSKMQYWLTISLLSQQL
jgi:hypothetical protein